MDEDKKRKLPVIQELYQDTELAIKENTLNFLLNQKPSETWLIKHPTIKKEIVDSKGNKKKVPIDYMPINRVEWLLTRIFLKWRVEVLTIQLIANSVQTTVRLHYKNPLDGEWDFNDGVGAMPIQTNQRAGAIDFNKMKSNAIQMAAPASKTFAVKDAAGEIGRVFGRDLNRTDIGDYNERIRDDNNTLEITLIRENFSFYLNELEDGDFKQSLIDQALLFEDDGGTVTIEYYEDLIKKIKDNLKTKGANDEV